MNVREPEGYLYSREKYDKSGDIVYVRKYLFDGLGSTIALTDENGDVTDTYSYDAWGNCTPGAGNTTFDNPYQYVGGLGYYTHYQESGFDLLQVGFRYYDSKTGRFTQQDPIQDGLNWYAYCGGNPVNYVDPWGLKTVVFYYNRPGRDFYFQVTHSPYFDAKSKDVELIPFIKKEEFVASWNKLDDRDIDDLYIYAHGGQGTLEFINGSTTFVPANKCDSGHMSVDSLKNKKVNGTIYLLSCYGGAGDEGDNLAWMFARKTDTRVIACMNAVSYAPYIPLARAGEYFSGLFTPVDGAWRAYDYVSVDKVVDKPMHSIGYGPFMPKWEKMPQK